MQKNKNKINTKTTGSHIFQHNHNPYCVDEDTLKLLNGKFACEHNILPISKTNDSITLYYSSASLQQKAQALLKKQFDGKKLEWIPFDEAPLKHLIHDYYFGRNFNQNNHVNQSTQKGFSLIELLIVVIISFIVLATVSFGFKGAYLNVAPESVIADISTQLFVARKEALAGNTDIVARTFNIATATVKPHNGITITNTPIPSFVNANCQGTCGDGQSSICVSNQTFCFVNETSFTFDTFSGKTSNPHVIFINSTDRKLAFLVTQNGEFYIAELINGIWSSRRDLQRLITNTSKG